MLPPQFQEGSKLTTRKQCLLPRAFLLFRPYPRLYSIRRPAQASTPGRAMPTLIQETVSCHRALPTWCISGREPRPYLLRWTLPAASRLPVALLLKDGAISTPHSIKGHAYTSTPGGPCPRLLHLHRRSCFPSRATGLLHLLGSHALDCIKKGG